jgi:hypothetical protein
MLRLPAQGGFFGAAEAGRDRFFPYSFRYGVAPVRCREQIFSGNKGETPGAGVTTKR